MRFRSSEKPLYKALNANSLIKYPIKVDIAMAAQKRSLIMQAELGGVEYPSDEASRKHKVQYQQDRSVIFANVHRLIRCVVDCRLSLRDGPATRHALELGRSLGARAWENSPLQLQQVPGVGPVTVRKLLQAGINSIDTLETAEPSRINLVLGKNPGFGERMISSLKKFPKPRVSVRMTGKVRCDMRSSFRSAESAQEAKAGRLPVVKFCVELGFLNEETPKEFNRKAVFMCFLAERSDGYLIDFRRMA